MNKSLKQEWLKALRSGQFEQTDGALKCQNAYCCLGVLGEILSKHNPDVYYFSDDGFYVSGEDIPNYELLPADILDYKIQRDLSEINDKGVDFYTIANMIENDNRI